MCHLSMKNTLSVQVSMKEESHMKRDIAFGSNFNNRNGRENDTRFNEREKGREDLVFTDFSGVKLVPDGLVKKQMEKWTTFGKKQKLEQISLRCL